MIGLQSLAGPPGEAPIQIWQIDLDEAGAPEDAVDLPGLSAAEEARAARFLRPRDAARYRRQRRMLRALLARESGRDGAAIELREQVFGRPQAVGLGALDFNLSRSEGTGWIALSAHGRVGIDGERLRPLRELEQLAASQLSATEAGAWQALPEARRLPAFLRAWSRKEAVLKALGCGLGVAPALIEVGAGADGASLEPLTAISEALLEAGTTLAPLVDDQAAWGRALGRVRVASLGGPDDAVAVAWLAEEA